jgi:hypothetical protein
MTMYTQVNVDKVANNGGASSSTAPIACSA